MRAMRRNPAGTLGYTLLRKFEQLS